MIISILPALISTAQADGTARIEAPNISAAVDSCSRENEAIQNEAPMCVFLHPGVSDTYKEGWSHTLDTLWGTQKGAPNPGQPDTNDQTRQVFDKYLDYAVLASSSDSIGDLQFDITIVTAISDLIFYLPPEFQFLAPTKTESVWTDITNDYSYVFVNTLNEYDPVAPHWTRVWIGNEGYTGYNSLGIQPGVYHVRFFNLRAPDVVGLYFFKIYSSTDAGAHITSIGAGNYPIIMVKGELNPAWVEVTTRTHTVTVPAYVSGVVTAEGTTPEGRAVKGIAYWGPNEFVGNQPTPPGPPGALYRVYLFGLPAGTYQITSIASGFNPMVSERFTVDAGQSYHTQIVIFTSPIVSVTVWSKHGTGAIPWHNLWQLPKGTNDPAAPPNPAGPKRDIFFSLYDSSGGLLGFWGSDWLDAGFWPNPSSVRWIPRNNLLPSALDPLATNSHYTLTDNRDLLGNARHMTSTNWEGHVPWDTPDYVAGVVQGQYSLEAYVTGYIMDEADAYQRSFAINQYSGIQYELQMDLRRSNWIETTLHLPSDQLAGPATTVTLTATDVGGNERAAASFYVRPESAADDGAISGKDFWTGPDGDTPYWELYAGGIVIEGWNTLFPNFNHRGVNDLSKSLEGTINDNHKDYGLNPTDSSHSAQAMSPGLVSLAGNPYTIKLYMADMGAPSGWNWLDTSPHIDGHKEGTGWYTIVPGDPQVSVFLCNSPTMLSFSIVNASAWISLRSVDFEVPAHERPWTFPGSEIWVQFMNMAGDVVDTLDPTVYGLIQDAGTIVPGFPIVPPAAAGVYGVSPFDIDNVHAPGQHSHVGVWYYGTDWASYYGGPGGGASLVHALLPGWRSTRMPADEYMYQAYTHAYIMRRSFPMYIPTSGRADIEADLIQGGQIRVLPEFFHEGVKTIFNGWIRVDVLDANGNLVGASIYGQAQPNIYDSTYHMYEPYLDWQIVQGPSQAAGFNDITIDAGGAVTPSANYPSSSAEQRAWLSYLLYGVPSKTWASWTAMTPSEANRVEIPTSSVGAVDVYGFYWYYGGPARTWAGGWPTTDGTLQNDGGIKGTVDIPGWPGSGGGLYTVKVWAFDPFGPNNDFEATGFSDDWCMYSMANDLTNVQVPWGGVQELYIGMNDMAKLEGTVRWYDMFGTLRPLPWARIQATDPAQTSPAEGYPAYTSGLGAIGAGVSDSAGAYVMWLPPGSHDISVDTTEAPSIWASPGSTGPYSSAPTYNTAYTVVVSPGWVGGGYDSNLAESGTPVPEVPAFLLPLTLIAALAASVWLLRKNANTNIPVLMK